MNNNMGTLADKLIKEEQRQPLPLWHRIMRRIRIFMCIEGEPPVEAYTARQAALHSNGQTEEDDELRVRNYISDVNAFIRQKCDVFLQEDCTYEVDDTVLKYKAEIMEYFRKKGYEVHDMKSETSFCKKEELYFDWSGKYYAEDDVNLNL